MVALTLSGVSGSAAVPANAAPTYAGGWHCKLGFKRVGSKCAEMTLQEKVKQATATAAIRTRQRTAAISVDGEQFTLRDVESKCEVWRWSDSWGTSSIEALPSES